MRTGNLFSIMLKQSAILICFTFFSGIAFCQKEADFKFGNVGAKDFDVSATIVSPDDAAVILYEAGYTHFAGNKKGWFDYVYTCTRRIKIINKKAFDLATVTIPLYSNNDDNEVLSDVKAATYNLTNGNVTSQVLGKGDIFSEKEDKNITIKKFTLPGIQEGSIFEYTYTVTSPYLFILPSWRFQSAEYPVLWSEYKVVIPTTLTYVSIRQGFNSFYIHTSSEGREMYRVTKPVDNYLSAQGEILSVNAITNNFRWVEKDVQPFKSESYVSSPENYVDKIEFQLSGTYNGDTQSAVWNTWQDACKDFLDDDDFQAATSHDYGWIKDIPGSANPQNNLDAAKEIYYYLQNNYTLDETAGVLRPTNLFDVYKKQKGSVRGINLLLVAMLNNKGIYAQPVMLSTKENGFLNPNYPVRDKFDYLICRATIDGQTYLLDATDPLLGFGKLPVKCFNGYARVIDASRPDSLYLLSDSLKETTVSTLFLSNDDNGQVSGAYKTTLGEFQSRDIRRTLTATNKDDYFKRFGKAYSFDVNISNAAIDSLDQKETPIGIHYNLSFKLEGDVIYFNPIATGDDMITENPFKAAQRSYPVEMPFMQDKTYIFSMQVPAGYKVDELPKSARVILNDNQGSFEYLIQQSNDQIQMRYHLKLNKATFEPEDYETLRNFYAAIVEKESEQIVFKKQ
jgi:transglutaminase-like putative cysteine protease